MNRTALCCTTIAGLCLLGAAALLTAGPLDPPNGPVAPTYKTLAEVEPRIAINSTNTPGDADSLFKITQPGSYYVTGNITGVVGKHGIEIAAVGVTLDLNGFDLVGVPGMGAFDGVSITLFGAYNVAVVNGSVSYWGDKGIEMSNTSACRIDGVRSSINTGTGIAIGNTSCISNCLAYNNTGAGISANSGNTVSNCTAIFNTTHGISTVNRSTVSNCTVNHTRSGFGITIGDESTVSDCTASRNSGGGISATHGCTVSNCTVNSSTGDGISTLDGCTITNCTAADNSSGGILANNGCQITGCMTRNNALDGISVNYSCTVSGNNCNGDGTAAGNQGGIRVLGQANRIEGNNVTYADHGVFVESGGNVIIRNTVKGCTMNWSIAADNYYGTISDRTGVGTAAVTGNTAFNTLATTDPHANFSY